MAVRDWSRLPVDEPVPIDLSPCTIALDGERTIALGQGQRATVVVRDNGPRVVDAAAAMSAATAAGVFARRVSLMVLMPSIAAVVATHNRPELLANRSLASIASQTRLPDYLIVVDDSDLDARRTNAEIAGISQHPRHPEVLHGESANSRGLRRLEYCPFPSAGILIRRYTWPFWMTTIRGRRHI